MNYRQDIVSLMDGCVGCGECNIVCPSYARGGCDPMAVLKGDASKVRGCIGCGACTEVCGYTDPWKVMMYTGCIENSLSIPQTYRDTGYHVPKITFGDLPDTGYVDGGEVCLAPGCLVNSLVPFLESSGVRALEAVGLSAERLDTGCCTFPVHYRSLTDGERDSMKRNGTSDAGNRRVVTLCPGCSNEFSSSGADAVHIVEMLHGRIDAIRDLPDLDMDVCLQPGCHMRGLSAVFREVVEATGVRIVEVPQACCGKAVPGISEGIMEERQRDMAGADAVIVGCPSCFIRYDGHPDGVRVLHISELVSLAAGHDATLRFHRN